MTQLTSNSLTVLAEQVRKAQYWAREASVEAARHYLTAGRLLCEAKAECKHGEWLPFLEAAGIHERRARRLMQLHRSGMKPDTVSEMGIKGALESLTKKKREPGSWEWAGWQLKKPFDNWDFERGDNRWLQTKFLHQVDLPHSVDFALDLTDQYKLPVMRLCDADEMLEALEKLAPYAKGEAEVDLDMKRLSPHRAIQITTTLSLIAKRAVALIFDEVEHREKIDQGRWLREREKVRKRLLGRIDARLTDLGEAA